MRNRRYGSSREKQATKKNDRRTAVPLQSSLGLAGTSAEATTDLPRNRAHSLTPTNRTIATARPKSVTNKKYQGPITIKLDANNYPSSYEDSDLPFENATPEEQEKERKMLSILVTKCLRRSIR